MTKTTTLLPKIMISSLFSVRPSALPLAIVLSCLALMPMRWGNAQFQQIGLGADWLFTADHVDGNLRDGSVQLNGNVRIASGTAQLFADSLLISENLVEVDGRFKVSDASQPGFTQGFSARDLSLRLDQETFEANDVFAKTTDTALSAAHISGTRSGLTADQVLYSRCLACARTQTLPWQVFAQRVMYEANSQQIRLYDTQLQLWGVAVFHLPYWQLANPAAGRLTGWETPAISNSPGGGNALRIGHFWAQSETRDVLARAYLHAGGGMQGDVRWRFANASRRLDVTARAVGIQENSDLWDSFISPQALMADMSVDGDWFVSPHWRIAGSGRFASNPEIGYQLGHDRQTYDRAHLRAEYFQAADYGILSLSQDQVGRPSNANFNQAQLPLRLAGRYEWQGQDNTSYDLRLGDLAFDVKNLLDFDAEFRAQGRSAARLNAVAHLSSAPIRIAAWQNRLHITGRQGFSWADGLDTLSDDYDPASPNFSGTASVSQAALSLETSTTLSRQLSMGHLTLQPRAMLTHIWGDAPDGRFANEDSLDTEIWGSDLFQHPFLGALDRGVSGAQLDAGLTANLSGDLWHASGSLGMRYAEHPTTAQGSLSALLINAQANHQTTGLRLAYIGRTQLNAHNQLSHDLALSFPIADWQFNLGYALETDGDLDLEGERWRTGLSGPLNSSWDLSATYADNLTTEPYGTLDLKARYADCCLGLSFYAGYDLSSGVAERSLGFELELLGLFDIGSSSLFSF